MIARTNQPALARLAMPLLFYGLATPPWAAAQESPDTGAADERVRLAPIVITPTRIEQSSFDVPASVDVVGADVIRQDQPQVNLSETMVRIPGIVAQNRQNYAQDLQISSRGFGARSPFGVRGVRLLVDGIPLTSPDGQGQAATIDLSTAERIEVLRGPFSALYGNSSGGVIAVYTEDPPAEPTLGADLGAGSYDTSRFGFRFGDTIGNFGFLGHASRFSTDGYREHSKARRDQWTTKLTYAPSDSSTLTFFGTALHQPETQDPRGLTREQVEEDPRQAGVGALEFDTRKSIRHHQEGLVYQTRLSPDSEVRLLGYFGERKIRQFLGIPLFVQQQDLSSGGVVDLDRQFAGTDARFTHYTTLLNGPLAFTAGITYDNQEERRRGFINDFGTVGELKRDEDDRVYAFDQYAQAEWGFAPKWAATAGVRHSEVKFEVTDHFVQGANPDDSGTVSFRETTPVVGLLHNLTPDVNLYANAGRGFETPTFAELAYRPDGASGLNFDLKPATSENYEIGAKMFLGSAARLNFALFYIETDNEIVVATSSGGRTTFQNAGKTERRGAELLFESRFGNGFGAYLALSYIDAEYADAFTTPGGTIPAGNRIPGVPRATAYGEISWRHAPRGFETALEARWTDRVFTDDANSESADAYTVVSWRVGLEQRVDSWVFREFVRVDNLFDEKYVGSVIVNDNFGRFYEPAPERNYFVGLTASYRF